MRALGDHRYTNFTPGRDDYRVITVVLGPGRGAVQLARLGLASVRDIVLTHGGSVFAEPRPDGGAAVGFTVGTDLLLPNSHPDHVDG